MLKTSYPALLDFAEGELRRRGFPEHDAEDLVQEAARRWHEVCTMEAAAKSYMRSFIAGRIRNLHREGRDAMTRHPLSLDATRREDP